MVLCLWGFEPISLKLTSFLVEPGIRGLISTVMDRVHYQNFLFVKILMELCTANKRRNFEDIKNSFYFYLLIAARIH